MNLLNTALLVLGVMACMGLILGFLLAFVNKQFTVEQNPLIHVVEDALPKGQCGACGYPGCMAYAEAVVLDPEVSPALCIPGKAPVAQIVAELTGKVAEASDPQVAHVRCKGDKIKAVFEYDYTGVDDCIAASMIHGGPKACQHGCLGLGTCVVSCPFDALSMGEDGLPDVDEDKCTGCGKCESVCPKKVIRMLPIGSHVVVDCNSKDKGAVSRKLCTVSCIGCGLCKKDCPHGAIEIVDSLSVVNNAVCREKCSDSVCVAKCPTKAIQSKVWS